jgi:hypothetical protein
VVSQNIVRLLDLAAVPDAVTLVLIQDAVFTSKTRGNLSNIYE